MILRKIECNEFVSNKFVLVLLQIDILNLYYSACIISICKKTHTNSLHTNSLHSISHKIEHVIQFVVHQFVHKTNAKKKLKSEQNRSPFIPRYTGIRRISTNEKKMIPYKPYVHGKHVESIQGTCKNMTKKSI